MHNHKNLTKMKQKYRNWSKSFLNVKRNKKYIFIIMIKEISTVITEYYDRINELEEKLKAIKHKGKPKH